MKISVEGAEPESASLVVVLLHGGGSPAPDFLGLSQEFPDDDSLCWLAPQAINRLWFPHPSSHSRQTQQPYLTVSAKSVLGLLENHAHQRIVLMGFADGAGVVAELLSDPDLPTSVVGAWLASGGLVGDENEWPEQPKLGSLPILVSGPHESPDLGRERLEETARYFEKAGAKVRRCFYDSPTAGILSVELSLAQDLLRELLR